MKKRLTINKEPISKTIKEAVEDYVKYCRIKNLSEATIRYYTEVLAIFKGFVGEVVCYCILELYTYGEVKDDYWGKWY